MAGWLPRSSVNGPGERFVVWVQGCDLGCVGCFNPQTHAAEAGSTVSVADLLSHIDAVDRLRGLTVSGGEPLQQGTALTTLLAAAQARGLDTLVFTGYRRDELGDHQALANIDLLVAGRFRARARATEPLLGSANQEIHALTGRIRLDELEPQGIEVTLRPDGSVVTTGFPPAALRRRPAPPW